MKKLINLRALQGNFKKHFGFKNLFPATRIYIVYCGFTFLAIIGYKAGFGDVYKYHKIDSLDAEMSTVLGKRISDYQPQKESESLN